MPASDFEFRHRTWFIFGTFCVGLACYSFDRQNSGEALASVLHVGVRDIFLIAALVVATGAMIRVWGEAYLRADIVHDSRVRSEKLVADGPFRYTRNPLYFGVLVGVFGAAFLCSRAGWIAQMSLAILFCYRLILREERELLRTQGESFRAYCRAVPRLLPALTPRLPASGTQPHWRGAFVAQTPWWGALAAEITYAATLRLGVALSVALAGFAIFVVQKYLRKSLMQSFISEDDLKTFEGWLRYQGVEASTAAREDLHEWRDMFDDVRKATDAAPKVGLMKLRALAGEYRYAVALRDGSNLWIALWVLCSRKGEFFVFLPRTDPSRDVHTSYHLDGTLHTKSFGQKALSTKCQPLDGNFRGTQSLGIFAGYGPKGVGAICDPAAFAGVVEVGPGILGPKDGVVAVDLVEPGCDPIKFYGQIFQQRTFYDTVPQIVITVGSCS